MSKILNVEFKAKSDNIEFIRKYLNENATEIKGVDNQRDTYFETNNGRLKLREGNIENSLIYYNRPDTATGPKQSDVNLVKVGPNSGLRELLSKSNRVKVVVEKKREIYFINNIKFHIDEVNNLGNFIEIEAIDREGSNDIKKLHEQCQVYIEKFGVKSTDFIGESYSDLLLKRLC